MHLTTNLETTLRRIREKNNSSKYNNDLFRLEGEFWGPTVDLLLDENIKELFSIPITLQ